MRRIALIAAVCVLLASCVKGKAIPEEYSSLVGTWTGNGFDIIITADGGASYHRISGSGETTFTGPLNNITDKEIEFGFLFFKQKLEIEQPPHEVDGRYEMVMDNVKLVRKD